MIKIEITDLTNTPPIELQAVIRMLQSFAVADFTATLGSAPKPPAVLDHADNPSTGVEVLTAEDAFSPTGALAAAAAFGKPNTAGLVLPGGPYATPFPFPTAEQAAQAGGFDAAAAALATGAQLGAAAGASANVASAEPLDSQGNKWDARIHSKEKTRNADGQYKLKRGVDKQAVEHILAANKAAMAGGAPNAAWPFPTPNAAQQAAAGLPSLPAAALTPTAAPAAPLIPQAAGAPMPGALPTAAPTASPSSAPPVGGATGYIDLVQRCAALMTAGQITPEEITQICQHCGVPNLQELAGLPGSVLQVAQTLQLVLQNKGLA